MASYEDRYKDAYGQDETAGPVIGLAAQGRTGQPVPNMPGYVYGESGQPVQVGAPVPGMPGQVYNSAGGMEPAGSTATAPATATATATPAASGGDRQSQVMAIVQKYPHTPAGLKQAEAELKALFPNLTIMGSKGDKIDFGDGEVVDLILSAGTGGTGWTWQSNKNAATASAGGAIDDDAWFQSNIPPPEQYQTLERPDYLQGEFKLPEWNEQFQPISMSELQEDPGYQNRLAEAQKGFERSAAAKGTILSGGTQTALGRQQQGIAANEYGAANSRALDTYLQRYGQFKDKLTAMGASRGINEDAYRTDVANSLNQYGTRYKTYRDIVDDQKWLSELGLRATTAGRL